MTWEQEVHLKYLQGVDDGRKEGRKEGAQKKDPKLLLIPGVVPITWEPSPNHLIIETEEAKQLFTQIKEGKYPSLAELIDNPVISQIDSLSDYYKELYGNTADIETP